MFDDMPLYMFFIIIYLITINFIAFFAMMIDKHKARKKKYRTPEAVLITLAVIGGSIGAILGMDLFRHKTKHKKFSIGLPVILFIHIILVIYIILF